MKPFVSATPAKPASTEGRQLAIGLYDYAHPDISAKEFFSFKANDVFTILPSGKELQGWKIAITSKGIKGFVPGNYLKYMDVNAADLPAHVLQHAVATGLRAGAFDDFNMRVAVEIDLNSLFFSCSRC